MQVIILVNTRLYIFFSLFLCQELNFFTWGLVEGQLNGGASLQLLDMRVGPSDAEVLEEDGWSGWYIEGECEEMEEKRETAAFHGSAAGQCVARLDVVAVVVMD